MIILLVGMIKQSESTQSSKFAISLQYIKKYGTDGVHVFHANKHQSFHTLTLLFLIEVVRYVQSTQHRKLVIFLQNI